MGSSLRLLIEIFFANCRECVWNALAKEREKKCCKFLVESETFII